MKIMAVDDEYLALNDLVRLLGKLRPNAEIVQFIESKDAFDYFSQNKVDIVFLDIQMESYTGVELAKMCKELCPRVNIIFVTGYIQYSFDALKLHASGYLLKPVRVSELLTELENLRYPLQPATIDRIRVQTFGSFAMFVDGTPLQLPTAKCKEALAYLIDRKGASITFSELSSILWEDKPYDRTAQNNTHRMLANLMKTLTEAGIADIVIKNSKSIAIDTKKVDCDYYEFIKGDTAIKNTFMGEYMSNYSWGEITLGELHKIVKNNNE